MTTFKMKRYSEHKGSVRFNATDSNAPVSNIYISRPMSNDWKEIEVTLKNITPVLTAQDPAGVTTPTP